MTPVLLWFPYEYTSLGDYTSFYWKTACEILRLQLRPSNTLAEVCRLNLLFLKLSRAHSWSVCYLAAYCFRVDGFVTTRWFFSDLLCKNSGTKDCSSGTLYLFTALPLWSSFTVLRFFSLWSVTKLFKSFMEELLVGRLFLLEMHCEPDLVSIIGFWWFL